jgi:putative IMPACT (imprinted ancient) family translation regulator
MQIITDYNLVGKIQYYIGQENLPIISSEYTDTVTLNIIIPIDKVDNVQNKLADLSNGTLSATELKKAYFAIIESKVHLF